VSDSAILQEVERLRAQVASQREEARIGLSTARSQADASIAELRHANEHLVMVTLATQELNEAAERTQRWQDEFVAMLAHELRNPLAPMTNALRLLERSATLGERDRTLVNMVVRQRNQLARIVDDLLEVARFTHGKIQVHLEPMDISAAVTAAIESMQSQFDHREHRVQILMPEQPLRVNGDLNRMAQVFGNLLTNASKYTPVGGTITVEASTHGDRVEIRVRDTGIGIETSKLPDLFRLFSQISATLDRSDGGLGVGLALVKYIVELHGGVVAASSPGLGQGACFTVSLPRAESETAAA
jgi:two-component system, sensor histidine kinase